MSGKLHSVLSWPVTIKVNAGGAKLQKLHNPSAFTTVAPNPASYIQDSGGNLSFPVASGVDMATNFRQQQQAPDLFSAQSGLELESADNKPDFDLLARYSMKAGEK